MFFIYATFLRKKTLMQQYVDDPLLILTQLINNKPYFQQIMHHMEQEYFEYILDKRIFKFIKNYSDKYGEAPTPLIVHNALSKLDLSDNEEIQYINEFSKLIMLAELVPLDPLMDKSEEFVKEKELKNAIQQSIAIYKGESDLAPASIPDIVSKALSKSIDDSHGEFYFDEESAKRRRDAYNNPETKIPFKIKKCNEVTSGGIGKKALHCFCGGPNVGKTAWMISLAADYVELGKNVLYITLEMSEAQIGVRFDARFLAHETSEIPTLDADLYFGKLNELREKNGKLIIKEYPTNELTGRKLETLVDELYTKHGFVPDVVFVDYLGICSSYYLKDRGNIGTYYTKVAEEFRACAQKKDFALWTAQQMTTDALDNTDPTLKNIGYGQGIAKTADMVWFGIRTEEMDSMGQLLIKQDKTRYHKERIARFAIGFDIGIMKMHDADNSSIPLTESISKPEQIKPKITTAFNNIGKNKSGIKA